MMRREDEEYCKSVFDKFLRERNQQVEIAWEDVELVNEPPDFYLEWYGKRFAVEVTTLVEMVKKRSSKPLPIISVIKSLQDIINNVERDAHKEGILNGAYGVSFGEPFDNENFKKVKAKISKGLYDYIRDTQSMPKAPKKIIYENKWGSQRCSIVKVDDSFTKIQMLGPTGSYYMDGIGSEICHLLREILIKKGGDIKDINVPKVLLILDQYGFKSYGLANQEVRELCVSRLEELNWFHTVFIVFDNNEGIILSSKEDNWG